MKTAFDRIPTPALVVLLAALLGLLAYGLASRGASTDGGPLSSATESSSDPTQSTAAGTPAEDGTTADPDASSDGSDLSGSGDEPVTTGNGTPTDADPDRAAAGTDDESDQRDGASGPVSEPDGTVADAGGTAKDAEERASEVAAFDEREATRQEELSAVEAVEPTLDEPAAGSLESDAQALADAARDEYFESQLDELEP